MLPVKFDLQLDDNGDLEYFKTLFLRNVGIEQMMYNFYTDNVMVRVMVSGLEDHQLISIGMFHYIVQDKSTTLTQFCPLADTRYQGFPEIQQAWYWNQNESWATFHHRPEDVEQAFEKIREILHIAYKVNKLKVFL